MGRKPMQMISVRSFRSLGVSNLWLVGNAVFFAAFLAVRYRAPASSLWDGWVANSSMLIPVVACFAVAIRRGPRRVAALWLGAGMLSWSAGNVIYVWWTALQVHPPVPAPSDLAYFGFYLCVIAALVSLARRELGASSRTLWLDGALGAAGAATIMTVALRSAITGLIGTPKDILVSLAYPLFDVILLAMVCGLLAVRGVRGGSMWVWIGIGTVVFVAADVTYVTQVLSASYVSGPVLNFTWLAGLTILCLAISRPERSHHVKARRAWVTLVAPILASLIGIGALAVFDFRTAPIIVGLASFTLVLAVARTVVSFRQVEVLSMARRQSLTDELTGLGNRRELFDAGERHLRSVEPGERLVLMLLDLDNFKLVNDTLGHACGDEVLCEAARRFSAEVRRPDLVIRLGGDEFALLVRLAGDRDVRGFAEPLLELLAEPFVVGGAQVRMQASAGIAEADGPDVTIIELLRRADVAMYAAKAVGQRLESYDAVLDKANHARLDTIRELSDAFREGEFVLHYQPKIAIDTGDTLGAEALVRWQHPTRGLLYPDAFLNIIEQSGSIGELTQVVLEMAIRQIAAWDAAGFQMSVAVNLSAFDLLDLKLPERVMSLLSEHSVPVEALELEITESVLMTDPARACEVLEELHGLGLKLSVDDYGTGYSSLAYLRDLPIDELKIDRSLIATLSEDGRGAKIVGSTIELAHALNLSVLAEGVEDESTLDTLRSFGCDSVQGFHFSRALPAGDFAAWARSHAPVLPATPIAA